MGILQVIIATKTGNFPDFLTDEKEQKNEEKKLLKNEHMCGKVKTNKCSEMCYCKG